MTTHLTGRFIEHLLHPHRLFPGRGDCALAHANGAAGWIERWAGELDMDEAPHLRRAGLARLAAADGEARRTPLIQSNE